VLYW
jgi:hypothetical protein